MQSDEERLALVRIDTYAYFVKWSQADKTFVARVKEFKSLGAHGDTPQKAFEELKRVVEFVVDDLKKNGEPVPRPYND